jgi:uncharacterized DUF497 family protein
MVSVSRKRRLFSATRCRSRFPIEHSLSEERYITMGRAFTGKLFVVVHTERGDNIRIISARRASRRERKFYEKIIE